MNYIQHFLAARRVSTPLIAVNSPDPGATVRRLLHATKNGTEHPAVLWDCVRGINPLNKPGEEALTVTGVKDKDTSDPLSCLTSAQKFPEKTMTFLMNFHHFIKDPQVSQQVWNMRDAYKRDRRTLILLSPGISLPVELTQDVLILEEPLPDSEELGAIIDGLYKSAELKGPAKNILAKAVDALSGLAAFPSEQSAAMSLSKAGVDLGSLWERKRQMIGQTKGLSVHSGGETFGAIGGLASIKSFCSRILTGNDSPRAIVFLDEAEKLFAGSGSDAYVGDGGVAKDRLAVFLTEMQNMGATGIIAVGVPGSGKSLLAKAMGAEGGIPTIVFDPSATAGGVVGESEAGIRNAFKVIRAVSQGNCFFIMTSNGIASLPPELRRRFSLGTFMFGLPEAEEQASIWPIHRKAYKVLGDQPLPPHAGWTGADIHNCCMIAYRLNCSLVEAAQYVVPISQSGADQIERLYTQADGRYLSASYPGLFRKNRANEQQQPMMRALDI